MSKQKKSTTPTHRRRGEALENAILNAAWEQFMEHGFENFTLESVAARASTSRPVIARRWRTKEELLLSAVELYGAGITRSVPNTGNLRDDTLVILNEMNNSRTDFSILLITSFGGFYSQSDLTPENLRNRFLATSTIQPLHEVVKQAIDRGEIDANTVTPRVISTPINLIRHDQMMRLTSLPESEIISIVDEVFLPLLGISNQSFEPKIQSLV